MLFLFESTHAVIKAERICDKNGITCKIVPVPRSISSQCGMGIEVSEKQEKIVVNILLKKKIIYNIYNNYKK
ncbi:MAG: DUF3343 domain-containing protein [Candidatus Aminicenantes bacterium]|nr:DUF3343 domain-containing protein [Candidatus Aminicenantes bacterium]